VNRRGDNEQEIEKVRTVLRRLQKLSTDADVATEPGSTPASSSQLARYQALDASPSATRDRAGPLPGVALFEPPHSPIAVAAPRELVPTAAALLSEAPLQSNTSPRRAMVGRLAIAGVLVGGLCGVALVVLKQWQNKEPASISPSAVLLPADSQLSDKVSPVIAGQRPTVPAAPSVVAQRPENSAPIGSGPLSAPTGSAIVSPPRPSDGVAAQPAAGDLLAAAQRELSVGHVAAARSILLAHAVQGPADLTWLLARLYDPNFLAQINGADAPSDADQAERWYRAWHTLAIKEGLVSDQSQSVERLIQSLR
jgi:hypothetical protein